MREDQFEKRYVPPRYPIIGGTVEVVVQVQFLANSKLGLDGYLADLSEKIMVRGTTRTIQEKHGIGVRGINFRVLYDASEN